MTLLLTGVGGAANHVPAAAAMAMKAAAAGWMCLVLIIVMLLVVDTLRRVAGPRYLWWTLAISGSLAVMGWLMFTGSATRWLMIYGVGAALVLVAVGCAATIGHLSFLGAYWLLVDRRAARGSPEFTTEQLNEIFRAREARPPERPNPEIVPTHVQRWARMTSPSLGEPGGILQKVVSEIFSSDQPAFYKHFLRLTTHRSGDLGRLDIFLHRVSGTARSTEELVVRIDYGPTSAETATLHAHAAAQVTSPSDLA